MWVFSYFRTEAESLHLAISKNGLKWQTLNNNKPILQGEVNTKTLRDPFLMCAKDGRFHMFCSDGWASPYIIHTSSDDLIDWSNQEAIGVMTDIPGARNAWAPECYYNREDDRYQVIWSSTVSLKDEDVVKGHRIWSAWTKDFKQWSPAELFFDPGYNVIDASVGWLDGKYLMAFKDERGDNKFGTDYKAIRVCTADHGSRPFTNISELITPSLVEGPTLFRRGGKWTMFYDHFMEDHFGASESEDGYSWTEITDQVAFPPDPRHGSVLEINEETGQKLLSKWG